MANVRELLARLNPTTVKYDIGMGGGAPELTAQDIAGALAFVPAGLGREVLCFLWWPEGAKLTRERLFAAIGHEVWRQVEGQMRRLATARLELHIEQESALTRQAATAEQQRRIANLEAKLANAARQCWPTDPYMVTRVRAAVLAEMGKPNHCGTCKGRGEVMVKDVKRVCPTCNGRKVLPLSNRDRARAIARDESTYRERWRPMYEWLWNRLNDAEQAAAQDFVRALGRAHGQGAAA